MTQPRRILDFLVFAVALLLLPLHLVSQSDTIPQISAKSVDQQDAAIAEPGPGRSASAEIPHATNQLVVESYAKLPLSFEANHGQTDSRVKFLSRASGYALFLTGN